MVSDDVGRQLNEEVWQAERAQQLMNDPIMKRILTETENQLVLAVKSSVTPDQAYKAAIAMQVFAIIRNSMNAMVETGKMAAIQLQEEEKRKWYQLNRR